MKTINNVIQLTLYYMTILLLMLSGSGSYSMKRPEASLVKSPSSVGLLQAPQQKMYFIYDSNTPVKENNGIWVRKDVVEKCESLTDMLDDLSGVEIPVQVNIKTIQLTFGILDDQVQLGDLSIDDLVEVINFFNFLAVSSDIIDLAVASLKNKVNASGIEIIHHEALRKLNNDIFQALYVVPSIFQLKKEYINHNKKMVACPYRNFQAITFNNGTQMLFLNGYNLILWDISQPYDTHYKVLTGHVGIINSAAFSPDGKKIISSSEGGHNNLILWDINDFNNITHTIVEGPQDNVTRAAFSTDGNKIVSYSTEDDHLILWDIRDPNNITYTIMLSYEEDNSYPHMIAFSFDDKKVMASTQAFDDTENPFILFDITNPKAITHKLLLKPFIAPSVAIFSYDNSKIVAGYNGDKNNLILCDISDVHNMVAKTLLGHTTTVNSVVFSRDSKIIISGADNGQNNLILWDISKPGTISKKVFPHHNLGDIDSIDISFDGTMVVSASNGQRSNLILWDISKANVFKLISFELIGHTSAILLAKFSPDAKKVFSFSGEQLIVWNLLTDEEEELLNQIGTYEPDQALLIYQLCGKSIQYQKFILLKKDTLEYKLFMGLPENMRLLLNKILKIVMYGD